MSFQKSFFGFITHIIHALMTNSLYCRSLGVKNALASGSKFLLVYFFSIILRTALDDHGILKNWLGQLSFIIFILIANWFIWLKDMHDIQILCGDFWRQTSLLRRLLNIFIILEMITFLVFLSSADFFMKGWLETALFVPRVYISLFIGQFFYKKHHLFPLLVANKKLSDSLYSFFLIYFSFDYWINDALLIILKSIHCLPS